MQFEIRNDRVCVAGVPVRWAPSPNVSGARMEPKIIVLHDTAGSTAEGAVSWFANPAARVSCHLVVDRDGSVTQCVALDRVAWHTAPSDWRGAGNCNGYGIGIEIVNPGGLVPAPIRGGPGVPVPAGVVGKASFGKVYEGCEVASSPKHWSKLWLPYTEAQLATVEALIKALCAAYPTLEDLVGHHDISPKRKEDPTPLMPWERMRTAFGRAAPPAIANAAAFDVTAAQEQLNKLGYFAGAADGLMGPRTRGALRTFQEQNRLPITGQLDAKTHDALMHPAAKEMPLGTRPELTAADLRAKGSATANAALGVKLGSLALAAVEVGGTVAQATAPVHTVTNVIDETEAAVKLIERVDGLVPALLKLGGYLLTPRGNLTLALLAAFGIVWWLGHRAEQKRLADARSGANASR